MARTMRTLAALALTAAVLLSGCMLRKPAGSVAPPIQTVLSAVAQTFSETTEQDTVGQTWLLQTEKYAAEECDVALPQERPQTTEAEETSTEEATTATTALSTTAPRTTKPTTTAPSTTKPTTTILSTTKPTTVPSTTSPSTAALSTTKSTTTAEVADAATITTTAVRSTAAASAPKQQASSSASPQAILNRAVLRPQLTHDEELDADVQKVFARIFSPGMTTYDKVLACYNYIINNSEYGRPKMVVTQNDLKAYQKEQDAWIVLFAKRILHNGQGVCDDYAALFLVMTRAIGLDCYYTHGYTTNTKGETKDHVWDTITVGGVDYIFDVQVEDKQSGNGIQYTFFCKTYDSPIAKIYSGYDLTADKAAYNAFRKS